MDIRESDFLGCCFCICNVQLHAPEEELCRCTRFHRLDLAKRVCFSYRTVVAQSERFLNNASFRVCYAFSIIQTTFLCPLFVSGKKSRGLITRSSEHCRHDCLQHSAHNESSRRNFADVLYQKVTPLVHSNKLQSSGSVFNLHHLNNRPCTKELRPCSVAEDSESTTSHLVIVKTQTLQGRRNNRPKPLKVSKCAGKDSNLITSNSPTWILKRIMLLLVLLSLLNGVTCSKHFKSRSRLSKRSNFAITKTNVRLKYSSQPLVVHSRESRLDFQWLYPSVTNLASKAIITSNATCGLNGPVKYCKLVEHVDRRWSRRRRQCFQCNNASLLAMERHPITNSIDGRGNRWWQSPTIEQGYHYHWVTITLDLKQVFQIAYVIVKAANSPRPGNWILERSIDGINWHPWQYFAVSNTECFKAYGLPAAPSGPPRYRHDTEVLCTSYFSQLIPLQNGEIHVSLINGRPSAENPSPELINFTSARFVRLRLQKIRTLHGDLMTLGNSPPQYADPVVTRRYYYSIKDISIGGMCICHGHATRCPSHPITGESSCICEHHTTGVNCEVCKSGFNQRKWQPGNNGFQCEECNCHGHADNCFYDKGVDERRESLNMDGEFSGGGVCVGCRDDTAGVNCETCADGFYRPLDVEPDALAPCRRCVCNPRGGARAEGTTTGPLLCVKDITFINGKNNLLPGNCICKEGYAGSKCDRCALGYRGFPSCTPCPCNISGSVNPDPCEGDCVCKRHVRGRDCSMCKTGFFNLQASNPSGCEECFCFGLTADCQQSDLRWSSIHSNFGWEVRKRDGRRRSFASIDRELNEPFVVHSQVVRDLGSTMYYWSAPRLYLGNRLSSYGGYLRYVVSYDVLRHQRPSPIQEVDVILEGNGKVLIYNRLGIFLEPAIEREVTVRLSSPDDANDPSEWIDAETRMPITKGDMMTALLDVRRLLIRAVYSRSSEAVYRIHDVHFDVAAEKGVGSPANSIEICRCPPGYSGRSCESCSAGYWRNEDQCVPCQCYGHSAICNQLNGACENCEHNTMGIHCERCKPGFHGDATWGTEQDCQSCSCPLPISGNNFSPTCRQDRITGDMICLQCRSGYTGRRCESCEEGYFGSPTIPGGQCQPCQCNGNSQVCNRLTGKCQSCVGHTAGDQCERCEAAYYGDAIIEKNCRPCDCHVIGSLSRQCNAVTGQCICSRGFYGRKCDTCTNNHYLSLTAGTCVTCDCDPTGSVVMQCSSDGACPCKVGVTGQLCDKCDRGYFGFTRDGCRACDCESTGSHCNAYTGVCVCPSNTQGYKCSVCTEGSYGWEQDSGCQNCNCNPVGSILPLSCNNVTGICRCKKQYGNRRCDQCKEGFYGFPNCKPCRCNSAGSVPTSCSESNPNLCSCTNKGQCFCKANTVGKHCDQCASNSFGLLLDHPHGCTACHCSGVTNRCGQAAYIWGTPISLKAVSTRLVSRNSSDVLMTQNLITFTDDVFQLRLQGEPYYWKLPGKFSGNKSLSYGGMLRYTVHFTAAISILSDAKVDASVVLRGGNDIRRTIQHRSEDPVSGRTKHYVIPMRGFGWTDADSGRVVTRAEFADVLSNVQFFLIKASYGYFMDRSRLSDVSLDVAIPEVEGRNNVASFSPAVGLEMCSCPAGYAGLSCQDCLPGYMRVRANLNSYRCEPCNCNNRSDTCSMDTGQCLDCIGEFTGRHCDMCKSGYYLFGSVCRKCNCPGSGTDNNFSPTCTADGVGGYTCDACRPGYEGKHCEECADGYYGRPSTPGGFCAKCGCNVAGSVDGLCDKVTGQCHCDEGIQGRICDQCQSRHVITPQGCMECDDECTLTLLLRVEELANSTAGIDFTQGFPPPWQRLNAVRNATSHVQGQISQSSEKLKGDLAFFSQLQDGYVIDAGNRLTPMLKEAKSCASDVKSIIISTRKLHKRERKRRKTARNFLKSVETTKQSIHSLLRQLRQGAVPDLNSMYGQVNTWISEMKAESFSAFSNLVEQEINATNSLASTVKKNFKKKYFKVEKRLKKKTRMISKQLDLLFLKLNDSKRISADIQRLMNNTAAKNDMSRQSLHQNEAKINKIVNEASIANRYIGEGRSLLLDASEVHLSGWLHMNDSVHTDNSVKSNLIEVSDRLQYLLDHEIDPANDNLMKKVTKEVNSKNRSLVNDADHIEKVWRDVSQLTVSKTEAVSRWTNILRTFDLSNAISINASLLAVESGRKTKEKNLKSKARSNLRRITSVYQSVMREKQTVDDNLVELRDANNGLEAANNSVRSLQRQCNLLQARLQRAKAGFPNTKASVTELDVHFSLERSTRLRDQLQEEFDRTQHIYQQLDAVELKVEEHQTKLREANTSLNGTPALLTQASDKAERTFTNMKIVRSLSDSTRRNISEIRRLIEDTRRKAASIRRVSVQSDGRCSMKYKPDFTPAKTTDIVLNVKTSEPDNMLLFMARRKRDFIAVETRKYLVTVTWDLGGGRGVLQNPVALRSREENDWYRIEIMRQNQDMNVTVYKAYNQTGTVRTVHGRSPGTYTALDINSNDQLFIGGLMNNTEIPSSVMHRSFRGCMGEAHIQGQRVGLWNFNAISDSSHCSGCLVSEALLHSTHGGSEYSFTGQSYSVLNLPLNYNADRTKLSFEFQTFSSNALLLFVGSKTLPDFLSLEIADGRLMLKIDLGNGLYTNVSRRRYNNGKWVHVSLNRNRDEIVFGVKRNGEWLEKMLMTVNKTSDARLDLTPDDVMSVGGLPRGRTFKLRPLMAISLVGCVREFIFMRRKLSLKANGKGDTVRDVDVVHTCPAEVTDHIGIAREGYVELPPSDFHASASFSITFSTREPNAILLFATGEERGGRRKKASNNFYTIYLHNGSVHVRLRLGSNHEISLSSKKDSYSDGNAHLVSLKRQNARVTLQMNDPGNRDSTTRSFARKAAQAVVVRRLFIGGIPKFLHASRLFAKGNSLNGCVRELILERLVNFKTALKSKNAFVGTCQFVEFDPIPDLPSPPPSGGIDSSFSGSPSDPNDDTGFVPFPTRKPNDRHCRIPDKLKFESNSANFGFSPYSHLAFQLKKNLRKRFSFEMRLRTMGKNGLLLYADHTSGRSFFALKLKEGRPVFQFRNGRETTEVSLSKQVNDGKWHKVRIRRKRRCGWLSVDKKRKKKCDSKLAPANMNINNILYVGGLPLIFDRTKVGKINRSMDVCIRNLTLNKVVVLNPINASVSHQVQSCFKRITNSSYFNGSGYAKINNRTRVGPNMMIQMDFRTWRSNAVLVSVDDGNNEGLALELVNGSIFFRVNNGKGSFETVYSSSFANRSRNKKRIRYPLCNGRWHHLEAEKEGKTLRLTVDQRLVPEVTSTESPLTADTKHPLYVGGLPRLTRNPAFLTTNQAFEGCIRNLRIKHRPIHMEEVEFRQGVFSHSCPRKKKKGRRKKKNRVT